MKVLIAIDGSPASETALTTAATLLGGSESAQVSLLYVMPRHYVYGKGGPTLVECYDPDQLHDEAKQLLDSSAKRLHEAGITPPITKEIKAGDPADLILKTSVEDDSDLIVLGSRGMNAAQRFLLGSVSTKVTSHAHCPVLVAHPKHHHAATHSAA